MVVGWVWSTKRKINSFFPGHCMINLMFRSPHVLSWAVMGWFTASTFGSQVDFANANQEKKITASRIQQSIVIDGILDEPQWELAKPVRDFIQQDPRIGEPVKIDAPRKSR